MTSQCVKEAFFYLRSLRYEPCNGSHGMFSSSSSAHSALACEHLPIAAGGCVEPMPTPTMDWQSELWLSSDSRHIDPGLSLVPSSCCCTNKANVIAQDLVSDLLPNYWASASTAPSWLLTPTPAAEKSTPATMLYYSRETSPITGTDADSCTAYMSQELFSVHVPRPCFSRPSNPKYPSVLHLRNIRA